jgi:metal-responsive CopG/Arc/MetJ family transcriptional regulator
MTRSLAIRIDTSLADAFDAAAREAGRSRSDAVREAMELWLRQQSLAAKIARHREGYQRRPVAAGEFAPVLEAQTWPR